MINNGQNILYRTAKDSSTLKMINQDISLALGKDGNPTKFNASEAIVVTYNDIPRYGNTGRRFKYQAVIATDYTTTFAILNYDRLDLNGNVVGYSEPGPCRVSKQFIESSDRTVLTRTSNVGIPGKHVHMVSNGGDDCRNEGGKHLALCEFLKN